MSCECSENTCNANCSQPKKAATQSAEDMLSRYGFLAYTRYLGKLDFQEREEYIELHAQIKNMISADMLQKGT